MRLPAIRTSNSMFSLLELDRVAAIAADLNLDLDVPNDRQQLQQVVGVMLDKLAPEVSGVVVEPDFGLSVWPLKPAPSASQNSAGLICALDSQPSDEVDPLLPPTLLQNWGVEQISQNYGLAKMTLYYHPSEENALKEKQLVAELYDYCHHQNIDLLLKLMIYTPAEETFSVENFQQTQLEAISEFRGSCDLMALQYPQDALACATLTTELDVPWVIVGDGQQYDQFKEVLRDSLEGGAQGFLAGEVFWQELAELGKKMLSDKTSRRGEAVAIDIEAVSSLVRTTVRDRVIELARIVDEYAAPSQGASEE